MNSGPMHINRDRRFADGGTHWHRLNGGWFIGATPAEGLTDGATVDDLDDESDDGGEQDVPGTGER